MTTAFLGAAAQSALHVLRSANQEAVRAQGALTSGLRVADASQNAGLFAVAEGFRSQVGGLAAIADSLELGAATVSVGRAAAEEATNRLTDIKTEIINAAAVGADTAAIQTAIDGLVTQIEGVVAAANLNGVNLVQNRLAADGATFSVLSAVSTSGGVTSTRSITVSAQDLQTTAQTFGGVAAATNTFFSNTGATIAAGGSATIAITPSAVANGASFAVILQGDGANAFGASQRFEYVARPGDAAGDVAAALATEINNHIGANGLSAGATVTADTGAGALTIANPDADGADTLTFSTDAATNGVAGGGLADLTGIDVTTSAGRDTALVVIESLLATATAAAAALGSSESRINAQLSYTSSLTNSVNAGIDALVGADLEEESARFQAAQAQAALAREMLAIANQERDRLLTLFS